MKTRKNQGFNAGDSMIAGLEQAIEWAAGKDIPVCVLIR